MAEAFADLETPLSLYLKLGHGRGDGKYSFLLESVVGGERFGRYSFIGLPARTLLRASGFGANAQAPRWCTDGQVVETNRRQPAGLRRGLPEALQGRIAARAAALLRWAGRLFRLRRGPLHREEAGKHLPARRPWAAPTSCLLQCEELAVIDNLSGKLYLIVYADPASSPRPMPMPRSRRARAERDKLRYSVSAPQVKPTPERTRPSGHFAKAGLSRRRWKSAKEMIAAGDFMQVQVGQRIKQALHRVAAVSLYRALRSLNPSPVHVLLRHGRPPRRGRFARNPGAPGTARHDGEQRITIRPLAGTRPRGAIAGAGQGGRGRTGQRPQGARRARDADRPGAQRHRPHCQDRHREGDRGVCGGALQPRDAHREQRRRHC